MGNEIALRNKSKPPEVPRTGGKVDVGRGNISDIILDRGKVSEEQVRQALTIAKGDTRNLGKTMASLGVVSQADLAQAQAQRLGLEYVELSEREVDRGAVGLVPERVLRKHVALLLRINRTGQLVVAMADPGNFYALEDLGIISGHRIAPAVAAEDEIRSTQAKIFATGEWITQIPEKVSGGGVGGDAEIDLGKIRRMILRRSSADEIGRVAEREGMVRLRDEGLLKAARGVTIIEEALRTL